MNDSSKIQWEEVETPDNVAVEMLKEWVDSFCLKCGWNLKGVKPERYCTHCDNNENLNRKGERIVQSTIS